MSSAPFLSILIPTRNRRALLSRALDSVLCDPSSAFEVVVSDNYSTDGTGELSRAYSDQRVRWFRQTADLGMVGNWNFCVDQARGERVLLLSDDDYVAPGFVTALLENTPRLRSASLAFTACKVVTDGAVNGPFDSALAGRTQFTEPEFLWLVLCGRIHPQFCSVVYERTLLKKHPFRSDMKYGQDMEAWIEQIDDRGVLYVPQAVSFYSLHAGNISNAIALRERFRDDALLTRKLVERLRYVRGAFELQRNAARRNRAQARYLSESCGLSGLRLWASITRLLLFAGRP